MYVSWNNFECYDILIFLESENVLASPTVLKKDEGLESIHFLFVEKAVKIHTGLCT